MKKIIGYSVAFKSREEQPIRVSVEGGEQLKELLSDPECPHFVPIHDSMVAINTISKIIPIRMAQPEKISPPTPQERQNFAVYDTWKKSMAEKMHWHHIHGDLPAERKCKMCDLPTTNVEYCDDCKGSYE